MVKKGKQVIAFCNTCGGKTNHSLLYEYPCIKKPSDKSGVEKILWELLECSGCDTVKVRHSVSYLETQTNLPEVLYYPPIERRKPPAWSQELPKEMQELQLEVYSAVNSGTLRLAAMGTRTLLDMAIVKAVGDVRTFQQKLATMEASGYLASKNKCFLEVAFDTGSAVAHRGHNPTLPHLEEVIDIVEHLLEDVFRFPESTKELKQAIPPRKFLQNSGE